MPVLSLSQSSSRVGLMRKHPGTPGRWAHWDSLPPLMMNDVLRMRTSPCHSLPPGPSGLHPAQGRAYGREDGLPGQGRREPGPQRGHRRFAALAGHGTQICPHAGITGHADTELTTLLGKIHLSHVFNRVNLSKSLPSSSL